MPQPILESVVIYRTNHKNIISCSIHQLLKYLWRLGLANQSQYQSKEVNFLILLHHNSMSSNYQKLGLQIYPIRLILQSYSGVGISPSYPRKLLYHLVLTIHCIYK